MLYLLGVAFVATRFGRRPSVLTAALSVAAFDFFYVYPYLTFAVGDTQYVVTFAVMLVVALLISSLAVRVRDQGARAREREERTRVLYTVGRELASLRGPDEIAGASAHAIGEVFHGLAQVLLPDVEGRLVAAPGATPGFPADARERAVAEWTFTHARPAGLGTDTLPGSAALYLPLAGGDRPVGVLGVQPHENLHPLSPDQLGLLEALGRQIAAPLEAARLSAEAESARLSAEQERLRGTLLSSVSHDLRTPLSAITGAASTLLEDASLGDEPRRELTQTIHEEALRLNRLVGNLLDMTRLEAAAVELKREWHSLEEVVGAALARVEARLGARRVETDLPLDLPAGADRRAAHAAAPRQPARERGQVHARRTRPSACRHGPARMRWSSTSRTTGPVCPRATRSACSRSSTASAGGHDGFGLGLAIARAIADRARRYDPCFEPASPRRAIPHRPAHRGHAARGTRGGGRCRASLNAEHLPLVLVVDDEPQLRALPARLAPAPGLSPDRGHDGRGGVARGGDAHARRRPARPGPARPGRRGGHPATARVERPCR